MFNVCWISSSKLYQDQLHLFISRKLPFYHLKLDNLSPSHVASKFFFFYRNASNTTLLGRLCCYMSVTSSDRPAIRCHFSSARQQRLKTGPTATNCLRETSQRRGVTFEGTWAPRQWRWWSGAGPWTTGRRLWGVRRCCPLTRSAASVSSSGLELQKSRLSSSPSMAPTVWNIPLSWCTTR